MEDFSKNHPRPRLSWRLFTIAAKFPSIKEIDWKLQGELWEVREIRFHLIPLVYLLYIYDHAVGWYHKRLSRVFWSLDIIFLFFLKLVMTSFKISKPEANWIIGYVVKLSASLGLQNFWFMILPVSMPASTACTVTPKSCNTARVSIGRYNSQELRNYMGLCRFGQDFAVYCTVDKS